MGFLDDLLPEVRAAVIRPDYLAGLPSEPLSVRPSLRRAVERATGRWALLVERKHESPGAADSVLPEIPTDRFVRAAETAGADGLSCLACGPRFRGSPREVAELVRSTALPVLFKDFVIAPEQVEAARRCGAAAVLLVARLERERRIDSSLADLARTAHAGGLEVLLELHDPRDLPTAARIDADLYGVNVRDLDSLRLRNDVARETFRAGAGLRPLLGLSGVVGPADASRFRSWGADGILVGTAFARAEDPVRFLRGLSIVPRPGVA